MAELNHLSPVANDANRQPIGGPNAGGDQRQETTIQKLRRQAVELLEKLGKECRETDSNGRFYVSMTKVIQSHSATSARQNEVKDTRGASLALFYELQPLYFLKMSNEDAAIVKAILRKMKRDEVTAKDIVKLHRLVRRVKESKRRTPEENAYGLLRDYVKWARCAERNRALVFSAKEADVVTGNRWFNWNSDKKMVGKWLAKRLDPLRKLVAQSPHLDAQTEWEFKRLMHALENGDLTSSGIIDLFHTVKRAKDPPMYALDTIIKVNKKSLKAGPNVSIAYSNTELGFKVTNQTTAAERKEAGDRIWSATRPFGYLFERSLHRKNDSKTLEHLAKTGELKSDHAFYLQRLLAHERDPAQSALEELNRLCAMADKAGGNKGIAWNSIKLDFEMTRWPRARRQDCKEAQDRIEDRLGGLKSLIPVWHPSTENILHLLSKLQTETARSDDLKALKQLVDDAIAAPTSQPSGTPPSSPTLPPAGPLYDRVESANAATSNIDQLAATANVVLDRMNTQM